MSDNAETIDSLLAELRDILLRMNQRGLTVRGVRVDWIRSEFVGKRPTYTLDTVEVESRVQ